MEKERKEEIKKEIKENQEVINFHRRMIDELKRELSFMLGHYDKTWEEEYCKN